VRARARARVASVAPLHRLRHCTASVTESSVSTPLPSRALATPVEQSAVTRSGRAWLGLGLGSGSGPGSGPGLGLGLGLGLDALRPRPPRHDPLVKVDVVRVEIVRDVARLARPRAEGVELVLGLRPG